MKFQKAVILAITFLFSFAPSLRANAEEKVTSILYTCSMNFKASGKSVYIGLGYTDVTGTGTISCYDLLTGATQRIPINVKARGPGAGLGITGLSIGGAATGVGVTKGPENLLGRYAMVRGNAAVGVGAAASAGLRLSNGSVTIDVAIEGQTGLGAGLDLLFIDIEAASQPAVAQPAQVVQQVAAPQVLQMNNAQTIYLEEGQPLAIVDANGRVVQTIYLKPARR